MRVCSIVGCDGAHYGLSLCRPHYRAQRRSTHGRQEKPRETNCCVCGTAITRSPSRGHLPTCSYQCRRDLTFGISEPIPEEHPARWWGASVPVAFTRCAHCAVLICTPEKTLRHYCSKACRRAARIARRAGRPRKWRKWATTVYERDGYICWLCGDRVDMSRRAPYPTAPTLDHLIPRSQGGDDHPDNLGTAHFICNARRGDSDRIQLPAA